MALPYDRKFNAGRQSELLYNEELHKNFEQTRHLLDVPKGKNSVPEAVLDGSLWLDRKKNELKSYVKSSKSWKNIFSQKFQIIDQMMSQLPPANPVVSQFWIYNDVLMYFNGAEWKPVKALEQDGSQFNLSVFSNFSLISPLWKLGNTIVKDEQIEAYKKAVKMYTQGKLDKLSNGDYLGHEEKWDIGHDCEAKDITVDDLELTGIHQFLVPNIDVDRVFLDERIDYNYEAPTKVCIEYKKDYIGEKTPTLIHVNPGRLTRVNKRLIKIDRENPMIYIPAQNTEFYGFRKGDIHGRLLIPISERDDGHDYECLSEGIYLSYDACQSYDYVLAVTFEFSWMKSTGKLSTACNMDNASSYFVQDYMGPMNVFVDGYELEEPYFEEDNMDQVVTIKEDTTKNEVVMMNSTEREFGFVRHIDLDGRAIIKVVKNYIHPLVFMNGEAIHPNLGGLEIEKDGNHMYVKDGKIDMAWCVIDTYDQETEYDMFCDASYITEENPGGKAVIEYYPPDWEEADVPVLFIDGLMLKKDHIEMQEVALKKDNEIIDLKDSNGNIKDKIELRYAYESGDIKVYGVPESVSLGTYTDLDTVIKLPNVKELDNKEILDATDTKLLKISDSDKKKYDKVIAIFSRRNGHLCLKDVIDNPDYNPGKAESKSNPKQIELENFKKGQDYILLKDRYARLYDETKLTPALPVGHLSETLVYHNNLLILNETSVRTSSSIGQLSTLDALVKNVEGEIKLFVDEEGENGEFKIWNEYGGLEVYGIPKDIKIESYPSIKEIINLPTIKKFSNEQIINNSNAKLLEISENDKKEYEKIIAIYYRKTNQPYSEKETEIINTKNEDGTVKEKIELKHPYQIGERWEDLPEKDIEAVKGFAFSYRNATRSIEFNFDVKKTDLVNVYAFNYANAIEHSLIIKNLPCSFQEAEQYKIDYQKAVKEGDEEKIEAAKEKLDEILIKRKEFPITDTYEPNIGSLSVWVNGVRQYDVMEWNDGTGFTLPNEVCGIVTYVIEPREKGATMVAQREVIGKENAVAHNVNVYKTTKPLYPGRVIVYIDGIRQAQDSFIVLDNYTILFPDCAKLISNPNNFPKDKVFNKLGEPTDIEYFHDDRILIEVKQDFDRQENHIYLDGKTTYEISVPKYELPFDIVEASDEIMIFIDGMFYGLKNLIGYKKDVYRNSIKIIDANAASRMFCDPLGAALKSDPALKLAYEREYKKEYEPKVVEMIFDWR